MTAPRKCFKCGNDIKNPRLPVCGRCWQEEIHSKKEIEAYMGLYNKFKKNLGLKETDGQVEIFQKIMREKQLILRISRICRKLPAYKRMIVQADRFYSDVKGLTYEVTLFNIMGNLILRTEDASPVQIQNAIATCVPALARAIKEGEKS